MKTITSVLAVSVFVSFFVWISALAVAEASWDCMGRSTILHRLPRLDRGRFGHAVAIGYSREGADVLVSYLKEHEDTWPAAWEPMTVAEWEALTASLNLEDGDGGAVPTAHALRRWPFGPARPNS
jgi:hypothetical protein